LRNRRSIRYGNGKAHHSTVETAVDDETGRRHHWAGTHGTRGMVAEAADASRVIKVGEN